MATTLVYPIIRTHSHLAMKQDKSVMAFYRVPNVPVTITDKDKKLEHKVAVAQVLRKLAKNKSFEISLIPKDFLLEEKMKDFSAALSPDSRELGEQLLADTVEKLTDEMEIPYQYDWLVGVNLLKDTRQTNLQSLALERFTELSAFAAKGVGYELEIPENWFEDYKTSEAAVYQILSSLKVQRLTDEQLFYYQRMQFLRYIPHLREEVTANRNLLNVTDTLIKVMAGGFLKLESPYGSSFLTILPIAKTPIIFNGFHLGEFTQRFDFPVELRINAEFLDKTSLRGRMERSNNRFENIMTEAESTATAQQDEIILGAMSLKDLMKKVGDKKGSILEYGAYLIVSASSLQQLRARKQTVLSYFEDMNVEVSEASFDTPYLFQSLLHGNLLDNKTRTWSHYVTPRGLAELMPFTNTKAGNRVGWHIGRVDNYVGQWESLEKAQRSSKNIVLFNATVGNKENIAGKQTKNPHILITGATGEGKSFLAELIFTLTSLQNVKALYVDPKRSVRKHFEAVVKDPDFKKKHPLLAKHIKSMNFVTLDSKDESNHGALDPIVMLDKDDAISVAKNMLNYLLNSNKNIKVTIDQVTAISEAITAVVERRQKGETVGLKHVLDLLLESSEKEVRSVGRFLNSVVQGSILELAFSYGDVTGLSYDKRVTVLEVADLALPDDKKQNQDAIREDKEINSTVLMFALGAFCSRFGELNRHEDTIEFFDEAWVLMKSAEGRAIIKSMRRVGRFFNNILCLITQSVHDAESDEDTTGFGTIFAFKEKNELPDILEHVGLEATKENLEWVNSMISGQCLYRDVYDNLNMITVTNIFEGIDPLLKPMAGTVSSELENKYAA
ncbi:ATP-binding protein [Streptococcus panodentis]|uniref:Conjugal transfer protein n=1 Tax=Streptococcus panodentis TaxID=1581472 RepID=A0ABS5AX63_9STRE|nr:ATP-binding protein [Streptococcus panodentis]MBP2620329.1 conjugal transfer protein [Streptococcus panodentis]